MLRLSLSRLFVRGAYHLRSVSYLASNSNILYLKERGLIQQIFPAENVSELTRALIGSPQTIYCGFDPTADSLHIGNLLSLVILMHCYRGGHKAIAVIGTATALIGDPSGRTTERQPMDKNVVLKNAESIEENIRRVIANCKEYYGEDRRKVVEPIILKNAQWYEDVGAVEFLCSVGRHFRMGTMLSRQSVQRRLKSEEGMSLTEFLYQVFQACDWLHLYKHYNCRLQIGGSDQMGNIMSGHDLIHHVTGVKSELFGITTPLVTSTSGNKLGKTAGNAIWLDPMKTSPFELYQYFIRIADADVENYLRLFTFLSEESIRELLLKHFEAPEHRHAQTRLAREVTQLVHGAAGVESAQRCTDALYKSAPENLLRLTTQELDQLFSNTATVELYLEPGTTVSDAVMRAGCFHSVADAERVIRSGGLHMNHRRIIEPERVLLPGEHILPNNLTVVRVGKKNYYLIRWLGTA